MSADLEFPPPLQSYHLEEGMQGFGALINFDSKEPQGIHFVGQFTESSKKIGPTVNLKGESLSRPGCPKVMIIQGRRSSNLLGSILETGGFFGTLTGQRTSRNLGNRETNDQIVLDLPEDPWNVLPLRHEH